MNLAVATAQLRDAWTEFEDALSHWFDPTAEVGEAAQNWWLARERYRTFLLEDANA